MNITEAMNVLSIEGRGEEARQIVDAAAQAAQRRYRTVLDDDSRTDEYKREELRSLYDSELEALTARLTELAAATQRRIDADFQNAFGIAGLPGDPASLAISRRDATDRVAAVERSSDLQALIRDSTPGDEVLARAAGAKALRQRDADSVNVFLETRPELDAAVTRLWEAERRTVRDEKGQARPRNAGGVLNSMAVLALKPTLAI